MPSLACIGEVSEVPEGKLSSTEMYIVQPVKIRAAGPGRSLKINVLYRPEWLDRDFDPNSLNDAEGGSKVLAVYRRNIAGKGTISTLKGLSGSDVAFGQLAENLLSLTAQSITSVENALREFFTVTNEGTQFIYVLKQGKQKVGEDENGKTIYELTSNYEVSEFHFLNQENVKKMKARANRSQDGSFRLAFDQDEF